MTDTPTPTPTPTITPTPVLYLRETTLETGYLAGIYYHADVGQVAIFVLWLVILGLFAAKLLVDLTERQN